MFFDTWSDLARVAVISILAYTALVAILRTAGKRSLAKLNIFDLVVTIAFGSTLATVLLSGDVSFTEGVLAFAMLALLQWVVSALSLRMRGFKRLVRADPRLLLRDGRLLEQAMREERITRGDVEAAVRKKGHGSLDSIAAVVLETDGELSVIAQAGAADGSALRSVSD